MCVAMPATERGMDKRRRKRKGKGTSKGFESRSEIAKKDEGEGREIGKMGAKGAVFHLINNANQIIQCSTVP